MPPTKIKFVVSFSSQDKVYKVSNLLSDDSKHWLSDPQDRSGQVEAIFQLEKPCRLAFIDIGVIWCATVEVRVGKSDWPQGQSYVPLVPLQTLMSPVDCRLGRNTKRMCMFSKAHFREGGAQGEWDRIQVVCRQPWRKDVQLGLSFLRMRSHDGDSSANQSCVDPGNSSGSKPLAQINSVADIQKHFFGDRPDENDNNSGLKQRLQKIASTAEDGTENPDTLPRVARMVLTANQQYPQPGPPGQHDNAGRLFSNTVKQQQAPEFSEEVTQFLNTLDISKQDIETLQVSDLRHKFEKLKWRKLTADEKRSFYACCQDFIGHMFDEESNSTNNIASATSAKQSASERNDTNTSSEPRKGLDNRSPVGQKALMKDARNHTSRGSELSPKLSKEIMPQTQKVKAKEESMSSGGFLRTVSSKSNASEAKGALTKNKTGVSDVIKKSGVTPNKTPAKTEQMYNSTNSTPGRTPVSGYSHDRNKSTSSRHIVSSPSSGSSPCSTKPKSSNKVSKNSQNQKALYKNTSSPTSISNRVLNGETFFYGGETMKCVLPSGSSAKKSSSPSTLPSSPLYGVSLGATGLVSNSQSKSDTSPRSTIDPSLLNSHKQFLNSRVNTLSSPTSQKTSPPSALAAASLTPSSVTKGRRGAAGNKSRPTRGKRLGSPLDTLSNSGPAKRQPKPSTPLQPDVSPPNSGGWLNTTRGRGRGRGGAGSNLRRKKEGPEDSDDDLHELPSLQANQGQRGRGRGRGRARGRGRGTANRRLELPQEPTCPVNTSTTPSTYDRVDDPFSGELQIDEDAVFVECPMCQEMFPSDTVNLHAAGCFGQSSRGASLAAAFVQCPLCEEMFPDENIAEHASSCLL
ncbi:hypothetical protein V1264_022013 [Littorina saxatilis]|uniref:DNA-repair protein Xrcc1 N-terminal domain-containing protein n=1 Tax=Littorina saxatilis TaxID=31220 RepID=A0AAN9AJL3_9CAEN